MVMALFRSIAFMVLSVCRRSIHAKASDLRYFITRISVRISKKQPSAILTDAVP